MWVGKFKQVIQSVFCMTELQFRDVMYLINRTESVIQFNVLQ